MSPGVDVWSCGGGRQSGAIAVLIAQGKLPKPDFAFMTNTGREKSGTWPFVHGFIRPQLALAGVELRIINAADYGTIALFGTDGITPLLPGYTDKSGSLGKLSPFCSGKWKRDVGERYLRSLGIERCRNWIGISTNEMHRLRKQHRDWLELWYPLIFGVPMAVGRCVDLIRSVGWTGPIPHSACYLCPNQADAEWIDMKENWPDDFELACAEEAKIRLTDPHFFCHPSLVPLPEVDFYAQTSMIAERGCTTGCFT